MLLRRNEKVMGGNVNNGYRMITEIANYVNY